MKKVIKRILFGSLMLISVVIIGLLINNLITKAIYSRYITDSDTLSKSEITQVREVYDYLGTQGTALLPDFDGKNIDLIIYNDDYEFLISSKEAAGKWEFLEKNDTLGKNIYRKKEDNPQAFTVFTNGEWVGSMSTRAYFIKSITTNLKEAGPFGYLIPPQAFAVDNEHYKGLIIHEMTHALEAAMIEDRLTRDQTISNVSSKYDGNSKYQELMKQEADYIEKAIRSESIEKAAEYAKQFLDTRKLRRSECKMTMAEIKTETEFEWLEGLARYTEYMSSTASTSIARKNLDKIRNKMNEGGDERFYAMGMAQALVLDKLGSEWKQYIFKEGFTFESELEQALANR